MLTRWFDFDTSPPHYYGVYEIRVYGDEASYFALWMKGCWGRIGSTVEEAACPGWESLYQNNLEWRGITEEAKRAYECLYLYRRLHNA